MFPWRKRNEGFEWREYVRTTILLRRQRRRELIDEAKAAAVSGMKRAGRQSASAAVRNARTLGHTLSQAALRLLDGTVLFLAAAATRLTGALTRLAETVSRGLARAIAVVGPKVWLALAQVWARIEPLLAVLRRPAFALPLALAAGVSAFSAAHRSWVHGLDGQAAVALAVAVATSALAYASRRRTWRARRPGLAFSVALERVGNVLVLLPGLDRLSPRGASLVTVAVLACAIGAATWLWTGPGLLNASHEAAAPLVAPSTLQGRATALAGDRLRVAGTTVDLDGIEAPEHEQECSGPDGRWRCGKAAKQALERLVRRTRVSCSISGSSAGRKVATCTAHGRDVAAELVGKGTVFAAHGLFSRYGALERRARNAKIGIWAGLAERPSEYRAKRWEEAKRAAPDGCPIKGRVSSGARIYLLPWSPSYDSVRVVTARGERWFCSEEEARAAGWRPVEPS